jgi:DNA-binding transcriptional MerR regulator
MEPVTYTPSQVAKRANIHANSVRNYSRGYAEFLSTGARGEAGPRVYTDEDVDVLCAIAALRKSGVSPGEVGEHLRQRAIPSVIDVTTEPLQGATTSLQAPVMVSPIQHDGYNALQGRVDSLERRIESQATIQRDRWMTFGMGVWIGMVTTGVILGVAWLVANSW